MQSTLLSEFGGRIIRMKYPGPWSPKISPPTSFCLMNNTRLSLECTPKHPLRAFISHCVSENYVLYLEKHPHNFRIMSDTITETIYVVKDRDLNCRYVGRTKLPLARRRQLHAEQLRTDWLACPLYRFMHDEGSTFDEVTIKTRICIIVHKWMEGPGTPGTE